MIILLINKDKIDYHLSQIILYIILYVIPFKLEVFSSIF